MAPRKRLIDDDDRPLTDEELAEMRPAEDVLPASLLALMAKRKRGQRGPGKKAAKVQVTLRLDAVTLEAYKATGDGWQTRINDVLRRNATSGRFEKVAKRPAQKRTA